MAKALAAALGLLLLILSSFTTPATAGPDLLKWSRVNVPADGEKGDWGLAWGSDIQHLIMANDGTLYACGRGLDYTLYSSVDHGHSWQARGEVANDIVAIAIAPNDASLVYYVTASRVYQSTDSAESFLPLPEGPGGAGGNNIEITSLDIARDFAEPDSNIIAVGTRDKNGGEFGGVYLLELDKPFAWTDAGVGNYDVYDIAFSPHHPDDGQLVAVVTDEVDTFITSKTADQAWGAAIGNARLNKDNSITAVSVAVDTKAIIVFPDDYNCDVPNSACVLFIGIDAGSENGDVYRIMGKAAPGKSLAIDLDIGQAEYVDNVDVTGLAASGKADSAYLIASAAGSTDIYLSQDGGQNWEKSAKPPTGDGQTYPLMANGLVYAATSGTESAFSISRDGGLSWNQLSFIDTIIEDIVDLAPSPYYSQDNSLFMLTYYTAGAHSLWRSLNGGADWERVYTSALADVDEIDRVALSPQYYKDNPVVFLAGLSNGQAAVWKSADNGQSFKRKAARFPIDCWAVAGDDSLFIGNYDGSNGRVYLTTNSGLSYSDGEVAGSQPLNSIVLSPSYDQDETVLIGNKDGRVYWSEDNGASFEPLPPEAASSPLNGTVTVAFDPGYSANSTVYAAGDTEGESIYRFIIGKSERWEAIDSPAEGMLGQLIVSGEGTLYASNFKADGGMERCLNPNYSLGPTFETVTKGLDEGAKLAGLWLVEHRLWAVDSANMRLVSYYDSLTQPVSLTSPGDEAPGVGTLVNDTARNIGLDWETLEGADQYRWQLDYDTDFSTVPLGFEGDTKASTAQLPALEPGTTCYWRVRAIEPVLSPWSDKWSFTTSIGSEVLAPLLESPEAGASAVSLKPIFQWSAIAGADSYELVVSTKIELDNPTILKTASYALASTAWQCNVSLDYDTTYYWKVRAVNGDTHSAWSAVGAFSTGPAPLEAEPPLEPPLPPQTSAFDWTELIMPMGGIMFLVFMIVMMAMLITMIVLVIKVSKL
ncbi:MAG: hypothetical protein HQ588_03195 [Deltaproteobacteria bacterium]|nr:hypothetical protein [Deltaproteobacteria bacterium]